MLLLIAAVVHVLPVVADPQVEAAASVASATSLRMLVAASVMQTVTAWEVRECPSRAPVQGSSFTPRCNNMPRAGSLVVVPSCSR